ncbi:NAD(P)/FAD-dependent oxidoreductase [Haliea atlantica]
MQRESKCLIVGASHAGAQAAVALRQHGWEGPITVIGDEPHLPYHRPPLSKDFLDGRKHEEDILIRQADFYQKSEVHFLLGSRACAIHRDDKQLEMEAGETLDYDALILATGARARRLDIPGAELQGIHYLRTLEDVHHIRQFAASGKRAVIIGGGYIGLETAASLHKLGLEVTVLEALPRVLARVTAPEVSAFYTRIHEEAGVRIMTDTQVAAFQGSANVEGVLCQNGEQYPADLVVVGVGILPNTELAGEAGLTVDNGILVDAQCRTSDPDIFAAGDCAAHYSELYQRQIRLESVQNAFDQASVAAQTLCGKDACYQSLPWFWSDQYDLKLQICGLSQGYTRVILRGDPQHDRQLTVFYLAGERLLAIDAVNRPQDFLQGKRLLTAGVKVDPEQLADPGVPLKDLLAS